MPRWDKATIVFIRTGKRYIRYYWHDACSHKDVRVVGDKVYDVTVIQTVPSHLDEVYPDFANRAAVLEMLRWGKGGQPTDRLGRNRVLVDNFQSRPSQT